MVRVTRVANSIAVRIMTIARVWRTTVVAAKITATISVSVYTREKIRVTFITDTVVIIVVVGATTRRLSARGAGTAASRTRQNATSKTRSSTKRYGPTVRARTRKSI